MVGAEGDPTLGAQPRRPSTGVEAPSPHFRTEPVLDREELLRHTFREDDRLTSEGRLPAHAASVTRPRTADMRRGCDLDGRGASPDNESVAAHLGTNRPARARE